MGTTTTAASDKKKEVSPLQIGLLLIATAATWGWLMKTARFHWGSESYYNFGWFVPLLVLFFLYRKLRDADFEPVSSGQPLRLIICWSMVALALPAITFIKLLNGVDIVWRLPLWAHGFLLLGLSYGILFVLSGWKGLRHFAFVFAFILMALPWPGMIETRVIQELTRLVTDLTVTVINLIGYPAQAMGNTIRIGETQVGVDEACSGIRSLQSLVMIALFLGEFFFFGMGRRIVMILGAITLSMVFNGVRAIILTLVKINGTEEKFDFWHDFLGNFNAIICGLILYVFAEFINWLIDTRKKPRPQIPVHIANPRVAMVNLGVLAGVFFLSEALVQGYYFWGERHSEPLPEMVVEWPDGKDLWHTESEIPEGTREMLQFEFGSQVDLFWRDGLKATAVHYGYTGEDLERVMASVGHTPKVCMTSIGAELEAEKAPLPFEMFGMNTEVSHCEFVFRNEQSRQSVQVFWIIWDNQAAGLPEDLLGSKTAHWKLRWNLVKQGRRDFGRQVILLYFHGDNPDQLVRQRARDLLDRMVIEEKRESPARET